MTNINDDIATLRKLFKAAEGCQTDSRLVAVESEISSLDVRVAEIERLLSLIVNSSPGKVGDWIMEDWLKHK
jgi:hypothetical protein